MNELYKLLKEHNLKIATAESCTGGMIASKITEISGISEFFETGVVTYSNEAKQKLLDVKLDTLTSFGAVSEPTAAEMSKGLLLMSGADIAISVTGIAGPTGGTQEKPVGLVYIGISGKFGTFVYKNVFTGNRNQVRNSAVDAAIKHAKDYVLKFYC